MDRLPKHPFLLSAEETAATLETNLDTGLAPEQVPQLQQRYGVNEFEIGGGTPWYKILSKQLFNAMVLVLFFAMALSFGIQDYVEGIVLAVVIVANVSIGFWQEYRAEKRMDALRALSSPSAMVLRDGVTQVIPNPEVVPGDIVLLKMGDTVPADLRLFECMNLSCDEQSLTGESIPVDKIVENNILVPGTEKLATEAEEVGIGDRFNIAWATTTVRKGRGRGIVCATGMATEVGKIAASATKKGRKPGRSMSLKYGKTQPIIGLYKRTYDSVGKFLGLTEGTPLQRRLAALAYILFFCALLLAVIVFAVNEFEIPAEVAIYATSLGIAIIPESLVAVLTITMVVAVTVMRKAHVVVRDLSALEALGGVTNICSDKTGTLTQGKMIVRQAWLPISQETYAVQDPGGPGNPTKGTVTCTKPGSEATTETRDITHDYDKERSTAVLKFDVPDEKLPPAPTPSPEPEVVGEMTPRLRAFLVSAALCNLATVRYDTDEEKWKTTGEPTEIALQVFAHRFKMRKKTLIKHGWNQVAEFPFDSSIKRMSVVYNFNPKTDVETNDEACLDPMEDGEDSFVFTKGAVERIVDLCSHAGFGELRQPMTGDLKDSVLNRMNELASEGERVLAIAYRRWNGKYDARRILAEQGTDDENAVRIAVETELCLLGLAGIYDPPRNETKPSIAECASAGIVVHMLTGDHPRTARAIAQEIGIIPKNFGILPENVASSVVQIATDFDKMTDEQIDALPDLPLVIARCAPDTKTRMIEALRRRNAFMAMTGDGVNDAPSLARADVGIAMGSGSDVAKSAAKIVLTDDKFNSIVAAIREGRRMFDNVQKFVLHLLSSNVGEVIVLVAGLAFRDKDGYSVFPISPLEILWINMVTSSFPAFGLGRERASVDIMRKKPHDKNRGVFTNQILMDMLVYGFFMGALTLATFVIVVFGMNKGELGDNCNKDHSESCNAVFRARATVFAELTWLILLSAWEFKDLRRSMFRLNPESKSRFPLFRDLYNNRFLFWAVVIGGLSVFPAVYIPRLNTDVFRHQAITWEWSIAVGFSIAYVLAVEAWKFAKRRFHLFEDQAVVHGVFSQGEMGGDEQGRSTRLSIDFATWKSFGKFRSFSKSKQTTSISRPTTATSGEQSHAV